MTGKVLTSADEAAGTVLAEVMEAAAQGTFSVGGCIVDNNTGKLVHAMRNNVIKPLRTSDKTFIFDPTAHGERQLVYWYYANKVRLKLPTPENLTVVTSLDPCVMCTGTLLTAGFNVAIIAMDDFAGINYDQEFSFKGLPTSLVPAAQAKFGYYACGHAKQDPAPYVRPYVGGKRVVFNDSMVSAERLAACGAIFQASVDTVRDNSRNAGRTPAQLRDPAGLPDESSIKTRFKTIDPCAFNIRIANPRVPDQTVHDHLVKLMKSRPNARNAVALVDPFGNVVLTLPDHFEKSPVHTAFMNVTRAYAQTRFTLMDEPQTSDQAEQYLTHPKYGTFVFLYAPDPEDSTTVMNLGAYGSTLEGPLPQVFPANLQYFHPPLKGSVEALTTLITQLPPFYTIKAQIAITQVPQAVCTMTP